MKRYWMVHRTDGCAPVQTHDTRIDADKEAYRLALKHPGRLFVVVESVSAWQTPTATVVQLEIEP